MPSFWHVYLCLILNRTIRIKAYISLQVWQSIRQKEMSNNKAYDELLDLSKTVGSVYDLDW